MPRLVPIPCSRCGGRFGGDTTFTRHFMKPYDIRCLTSRELYRMGWTRDRDGVWHRPVSDRLRPPETNGEQLSLSPTENTPGKAHKAARDTERKAAHDITPRTGTARARVLLVIGISPRTDDEMQRVLGMNPNTQRPRRVELVEGGFIEDSGQRRKTPSNSDAIVWQVTPRGRLWCLQEQVSA